MALKLFSLVIFLFLVYISICLIQGTMNDYQPAAKIELKNEGAGDPNAIQDSVLTFVSWNIGFCGLGAEANFFFDNGGYFFSHGDMVYPPRNLVDQFLHGFLETIRHTQSNFFMIQEIDRGSNRSYFTEQFDSVRQIKPDYAASFALNYQVSRVPIPVCEPWHVYGKTYSGIATFGKYAPVSNERLQLPGKFSWPTRIFQLDRCLLVQRYKVKNGKELVLINAHLSAYDKDGSLKAQEMKFLREYCLKEYEKGNYVIVGADWNQCPPFFPFDTFMPGKTQGYSQFNIAPDYFPEEWQWIYDPVTPTNRKAKLPYEKGVTFVTIIDYFLISPNVQAKTIRCLNQDFRYADHQPVYLEAILKER